MSKLESKRQNKKLVHCSYKDKFIDKLVVKKLSKCSYFYSKKPC